MHRDKNRDKELDYNLISTINKSEIAPGHKVALIYLWQAAEKSVWTVFLLALLFSSPYQPYLWLFLAWVLALFTTTAMKIILDLNKPSTDLNSEPRGFWAAIKDGIIGNAAWTVLVFLFGALFFTHQPPKIQETSSPVGKLIEFMIKTPEHSKEELEKLGTKTP